MHNKKKSQEENTDREVFFHLKSSLLSAGETGEGSALGSTQLPTYLGGRAWKTEADFPGFCTKEKCRRTARENLNF